MTYLLKATTTQPDPYSKHAGFAQYAIFAYHQRKMCIKFTHKTYRPYTPLKSITPKSCIPNTTEMLFYKYTNELMFDKMFCQFTVKMNPENV